MAHRIVLVAALAVSVALALLAAPALAQDYRKGLEAANHGDYATALQEWKPLAEQGNAVAQASLAGLYALGHGVPPDIAEALRWYRLAASQGLATAQYNLGQLLASRQAGDLRDDAEARKWYGLAADQGNAEAHYKLGLLLANGAGGVQDFVGAHMHWSLAEALGFKDATRQLDSLTKLMPPAQIAEAQRRAAAWMTGYEQRQDEIVRLRHALAERESEGDRLRRLLAERQGEAAALRQTIAELDSAITGLKAQARERQAATDARKTEADALRRTIAELDGTIADLRATEQTRQAAIAARNNEADAWRHTIAGLDSTIAELRAKAQERQATIASLSATTPPAELAKPAEAPKPVAATRPAEAPSDTDTATSPAVPDPARAPKADEATVETASPAKPAAAKPAPPAAADTEDRWSSPADLPSDAAGVAAYKAGDYAKAFTIWQARAKAGDASAQFHLGALYYEGRGAPHDLDEARHWLGVAARNGSEAAQAMLETVE